MKGIAHDPNHVTASVSHGGGSVVEWLCMAADGSGSLMSIDDVCDDKSDSLKCIIIYSDEKLPLQMDNDPVHGFHTSGNH